MRSDRISYCFKRTIALGLLLSLTTCLSCSEDSSTESGLNQRPVNPTCVAPDRPKMDVEVESVRVFPNLSFERPVSMVQPPEDDSLWFVGERDGKVIRFENDDSTTSKVEEILQRGKFHHVSDMKIGPDGMLYVAYRC